MHMLKKRLVTAILLSTCIATSANADSPAEMLEKGIYKEDTVGDLDAAIEIYREVVSVAGETEALAAKAQFRLANCLLKQGKKEEAATAFKAIVTDYPNQKDVVAKAKKHLPSERLFQKAPWKDGERLTLQMEMPGGQVIGLIGVGVDTKQVDGNDVWEMTIRRFIAGGQNEGVSKVWVDKTSFRPARTIFDHTVLGTTNADWADDKITLTKKVAGADDEESTVGLDSVAYSNDQCFYGFRQLPLKVGYKVTIPIRVAFTGGNPIGLEVEVAEKEEIETPHGKYDCFRLETNIAQTFWVSDTPERYIVQFEAQGVTAKLTAVSYLDKATKYENEHGVSCAIPAGWFYFERESSDDVVAVSFVSPEMASASLVVKDKSDLEKEEQESLRAWMDASIEKAGKMFKDFKPGPAGVHDSKLGSLTALAVETQHKLSRRDFAMGTTLGLGEEKCVRLSTMSSMDGAGVAKEQFDVIRNSVEQK